MTGSLENHRFFASLCMVGGLCMAGLLVVDQCERPEPPAAAVERFRGSFAAPKTVPEKKAETPEEKKPQ